MSHVTQPLLQNRAAVTNWGKMYYKLWQVVHVRAIITNWGIRNGISLKSINGESSAVTGDIVAP